LTKCDLFFADKAILVEGASERIILPDMIRKYGQKDRDSGNSHPLSTQYYTIIEVGGAYAYIFMPFMDFLNIPCLIITDIDSVATDENDNGHAKSVPVSNGTTTSNQTIKWWIRKKHAGRYDSPKSVIPLSVIQSMTKEDKQIEKCRITFQTEEDGLTGRSLEESIRNVNRTFYGIPEDTSDDSELKFKVGNKGETKTDFALSLLYEKENYEIPAYIIDGIKWLTSTRIVD
jgi:predicted ATP-dependent endonuclease of OLD family